MAGKKLINGPFDGKQCPTEDGNVSLNVMRNVNGKMSSIPAVYVDYQFSHYETGSENSSVKDMITGDRKKKW